MTENVSENFSKSLSMLDFSLALRYNFLVRKIT